MKYKNYFFILLLLILSLFLYQMNKPHPILPKEIVEVAVSATEVKNQNKLSAPLVEVQDKSKPVVNNTTIKFEKNTKHQTLKLKGADYPIALQYSFCPVDQCKEGAQVREFSKYYSIQNIPIKEIIDDSSSNLVVLDTNSRNRPGMWNKNILISVEENTDIQLRLEDMGLKNIKMILPKLYVAAYNGEISKIDETLEIISDLSDVINIELEIKFQERK